MSLKRGPSIPHSPWFHPLVYSGQSGYASFHRLLCRSQIKSELIHSGSAAKASVGKRAEEYDVKEEGKWENWSQ